MRAGSGSAGSPGRTGSTVDPARGTLLEAAAALFPAIVGQSCKPALLVTGCAAGRLRTIVLGKDATDDIFIDIETEGEESCSAIRRHPKRRFRWFSSMIAATSSGHGLFGPGSQRCFGENSRWYFR